MTHHLSALMLHLGVALGALAGVAGAAVLEALWPRRVRF